MKRTSLRNRCRTLSGGSVARIERDKDPKSGSTVPVNPACGKTLSNGQQLAQESSSSPGKGCGLRVMSMDFLLIALALALSKTVQLRSTAVRAVAQQERGV